MKKQKYPILLLFPLFFFLSSKEISADSIAPFINEVNLKENERTREELIFTNDGDSSKEILLQVYGYNSQTDDIDNDIPTLLRVDTDSFLIKPNESKELPYEIVLPEGIEIGTYFNLLILEPIPQVKNSAIITSPSVSQIVKINIYPADSAENKIPKTPADITLEIVHKGIPWIKATEIRYTYRNISNYILQPKGEIQVFNEKQNTEPIYLKINKEKKLLYPEEELSETLKVNTWNIYDLIYKRVVLGRFYNGVDGEYQGEQTTIQDFKNETVITGVVILFLFVILRESLKNKGGKVPEDYDMGREDEEE